MTAIANRYDFVLLFDVTRGNPNGDPDAGNMPRIDPETNFGFVSDVSLKRKIRNYVELAHRGEDGRHIYVQEGSILNEQHRQAYKAKYPDDPKIDKAPKLNPKNDDEAKEMTGFMCRNFFDVRTFGAGKAPAHALFERVRVGRNIDGEFRDVEDRGIGNEPPARKFSDYKVDIVRAGLPDGVEIIERL
jgi:CRISPR/Cas system type I-B associated protein Csh2 (Cas7 group RAMP superfamily)